MEIDSVILCGGQGLRVRYITRIPKQFFLLESGFSTFMLTLKRAALVSKRIWVIANFQDLNLVKTQVNLVTDLLQLHNLRIHFLFEIHCCNTLHAISLAFIKMSILCTKIRNVLVMPADHLIEPARNFVSDIKIASTCIGNSLVLFGIQPYESRSEFGHIELCNQKLNPKLQFIKNFIEKPSPSEISKLRFYLWNSGIFFSSFEYFQKILRANIDEIRSKIKFSDQKSNLAIDNQFFLDSIVYKSPEALPFDILLQSKLRNLKVLKVSFNWLDIGSTQGLKNSFLYKEGL